MAVYLTMGDIVRGEPLNRIGVSDLQLQTTDEGNPPFGGAAVVCRSIVIVLDCLVCSACTAFHVVQSQRRVAAHAYAAYAAYRVCRLMFSPLENTVSTIRYAPGFEACRHHRPVVFQPCRLLHMTFRLCSK